MIILGCFRESSRKLQEDRQVVSTDHTVSILRKHMMSVSKTETCALHIENQTHRATNISSYYMWIQCVVAQCECGSTHTNNEKQREFMKTNVHNYHPMMIQLIPLTFKPGCSLLCTFHVFRLGLTEFLITIICNIILDLIDCWLFPSTNVTAWSYWSHFSVSRRSAKPTGCWLGPSFKWTYTQ